MNKILLNGEDLSLDSKINEAEITVKNNSTLNIINSYKSLNLHIKIEKNANFTMNILASICPLSTKLTIDSDDSSTFTLNNAFISEEKYELNIDTNLYGSNIVNKVNVRGINEIQGTAIINMNGVVAGETKNNEVSIYAKVINKSMESNVLIPNLIVNTNDVIANHGVSIGGFRNEELFYLMSKGLDIETSKKIIEEGFILSIFDEDIKGLIKNILLGR